MRLVLSLLCLALAVCIMLAIPMDGREVEHDPATDIAELRERAVSVSDLTWVDPAGAAVRSTGTDMNRTDILRERERRAWAGDHVGVARLNALFAAEGFERSRLVLDRWLPRFDPATGLLLTSAEPDGRVWVYGDTGSDLFPHLAIAAHVLAPEHNGLFTRVLEAERRLEPEVPDDVHLPSGDPVGLDLDDRIFGTAEYGKDGLVPMLDRLGPDPWLGRLVEIADTLLAASAKPTREHGMLPADSTEVNGDTLQILARTFWATGERKYLEAAGRISRAYIREVFPTTRYLPPNRWDFVENEPLDRRRFRLSDHGNEILPGLLEWHFAATMAGDPEADTDREAIRRMLDRLAEKGRSPDGLWMRVIEIPSGDVDQEGYSDNWGYVSQAFLLQSLIESVAPQGDQDDGDRYREVAEKSLDAVASYRYYNWQWGEMDGYADAIESAIYLLHEIDDPAAELWLDDQIGALYGFQDDSGEVLDGYLDGNFIRSALLNAFRLTGGARLDPWSPDLLLGGSIDGECLVLWATSSTDWQGTLILDRPRHRDFGNMPYDYPRLNKWPEWFTADANVTYRVTDEQGVATDVEGRALVDGLPMTLPAGQERVLRVCRAA